MRGLGCGTWRLAAKHPSETFFVGRVSDANSSKVYMKPKKQIQLESPGVRDESELVRELGMKAR